MFDILIRACFFLLMVVLGYVMKKIGVLTKEDGVAVARVILNITLPCAILVSFRSFVFEWSYMIIPLVSFMANWLLIGIGYMISRRGGRDEKVYYMLSLPTYNIGNFMLPFVSGILGSTGVVATCLFDMGSSPMCLGLGFMLTALAIGEDHGRSVFSSIMQLFTKPSFTVYFVMLVLSMFSLSLPDPVFDFAAMISPANGPMAMIMIGLMLEFSSDRTKLKEVLAVNGIRLVVAVIIAFLFFSFAPFPYEVRKAVAITAFAPISSSSAAFVSELKGDVELEGFSGTVSIVIALILMPLLFTLL